MVSLHLVRSQFFISIFSLLFLCFGQSCQWFKNKNNTTTLEDPIIAKVGDNVLYFSDISHNLDLTPSDSAQRVSAFAHDWVRQQLVLRVAEDNKSLFQDDLDKQIKDFSESLTIYHFENELIKSKLDSNIAETELQQYYYKHQNEYILNHDIVKCVVVMFPKENTKVDSVNKWLKNFNPENQNLLTTFCDQEATYSWLNVSEWYNTDRLAKLCNSPDLSSQLSIDRTLQFSDSTQIIALRIIDIKKAGIVPPFDYMRSNIRNLLINQRKKEFIKKVYDNIYQDALKNNDFEIKKYEPKK